MVEPNVNPPVYDEEPQEDEENIGETTEDQAFAEVCFCECACEKAKERARGERRTKRETADRMLPCP